MQTYDAIVVGGGPSGSCCASELVKGGARVLIVDGATFPREKLCAGWVTPPFWDVLGLSPREYPGRVWEWSKGHVHFAGRTYTLHMKGYFIRRYELDDFLLRRSKAPVREGHFVRHVERDADGTWILDGDLRARVLIGAGGSHCPVARALFPKRAKAPCGTQEKEFAADPAEIAAYRVGEDGEPQILIRDDLRGYSWNVPKTGWLNIGTGTAVAREVTQAWHEARAFFEQHGGKGNVPPSARPMLDKMKGHGYSSFAPEHLTRSAMNDAFLVGDAFGLAHPITGEGLVPSVLSGKLCGAAIAEGNPGAYIERLRSHPLIVNYRIVNAGLKAATGLFEGAGGGRLQSSALLGHVLVSAFGWMFSGHQVPGSGLPGRLSHRSHTAAAMTAT